MKIKEIDDKLGFCGINCGKCFAFIDGSIKQNSAKLKESLGNFDDYAARFSELLEEPRFNHYKAFKELLDFFVAGNCSGCRKDGCKIFKSCKVRGCAIEKKVDYCFQCISFPCDNTGFDAHLKKRWIKINERMKKIGVVAYYDEIKELSRY